MMLPEASPAFKSAANSRIDDNDITHASIGIELDQNVHGASLSGNRFESVERPLLDWRE
jgi:parallel beta-helix repeat protein